MGTAVLFTSGATSAATFSVAAASLIFFVTSEKRQRRCFFQLKKWQRFSAVFLSKFSAAAATVNKLLPRLFSIYIFTRYRLESTIFFTLLLLPHYFSLVEQCYLCDVLSLLYLHSRVLSYVVLIFLNQNLIYNVVW